MANNPCTPGALQRVFEADIPTPDSFPNPILQVLQIKSLAAQPGAPERYRVVFSDTQNFIQSMLATQATAHVLDGSIEKGCFVQLTNYQANKVKDKKILIVIGLEVLTRYGKQEKIGEPVSLEASQRPQAPDRARPAQNENASATSFYGNRPAPAPAEQRGVPARQAQPTTTARSSTPSTTRPNIYPIESLSPYQNRWTIRARVTFKSPIKLWHNSNRDGRLFNVTLLDESGEIRATGFNDQVDSFYEVLQEGQIYYISNCKVNFAKKQFSNINNDYELAFERHTEIEKCNDVDDGLPMARFNFVQFSELESIQNDGIIDVIGVIKEVGEVAPIQSKATQKSYTKRDVDLVDKSGYSVRITIWGKYAEDWETQPDEIVAFKGVKVSEYGGRSLSMLHSSTMTVNPDIDESHALRGWYDGQGRGETFQSHYTGSSAVRTNDPYKTLFQIRDENLGMGEEADIFTTKATIVYIKNENFSYPACLTPKCNKKVVELAEGQWKCEKCDITHPKCQHRYIMTISCSDAFGLAWFSCFDDVGTMIMGMTADELVELNQSGGPAFADAFSQANCKTYVFRCRAKLDVSQGQQRVRYQVLNAAPVSFALEAHKLIGQIKLYS
ncbi:hypothetical protein HOY80DRAFT_350874 [Tuber brumale]|nr:hypothetical protein HOY80DRAFT_350874 [Tuber brumale]